MELPPINTTTAAPGTPLRPYWITYTRRDIEQFLERTGETANNYECNGVLYVPPGMVLGAYARLIHGTFHYEAGVHVASDFVFDRVPVEGETLQVTGNILHLFERNGDKYVTFLVVLTSSSGERIGEIEHTSIYELRPRAPRSLS